MKFFASNYAQIISDFVAHQQSFHREIHQSGCLHASTGLLQQEIPLDQMTSLFRESSSLDSKVLRVKFY